MKKTFSPKEYIKFLGKELVSEFEKAGMTTHSHAVGGGRENSAREKLKSILPSGIGVGSGFVIDSFGNTSKQCDIILYEENYAMKFIINGDDSNAYYNCESVIAVGEIKSVASTKEVKDAIEKLSVIKKLKRQNDDGYNIRKYLTSTALRNSLGDEKALYDNTKDPMSQIYTFLLCQKINMKTENIINCMNSLCKNHYEYINKIVSTDGAYISYLDTRDSQEYKLLPSRIDATAAYNLIDNEYSFNYFIHDLINFVSHAITVPLNYVRYLSMPLKMSDLKEILPL